MDGWMNEWICYVTSQSVEGDRCGDQDTTAQDDSRPAEILLPVPAAKKPRDGVKNTRLNDILNNSKQKRVGILF